MDALEYVRNKHRQLKLVFTVMPPMKDTTAVYNAVKSKCLTEYGGKMLQKEVETLYFVIYVLQYLLSAFVKNLIKLMES